MQRIGFTVSAGFQTMSLAVISVFEFANMEIGKPAMMCICCPRMAGRFGPRWA
jgi:hypothetical protein